MNHIAAYSLGFLSLSGGAMGAAYGASNKTILSQVQNDVLISQEKEDWKELEKLFKTRSQDDNEESIKNIKETEITEESWEKLKTWCNNQYNSSYSNIFKSKKSGEKIKTKTATYCSLSVKERLGSNSVFFNKETDKASIQKRIDEIQKNENIENSVLKSINANKLENKKEENINNLFNWCSTELNKKFQQKTQKDYSEIEKYCVKKNEDNQVVL